MNKQNGERTSFDLMKPGGGGEGITLCSFFFSELIELMRDLGPYGYSQCVYLQVSQTAGHMTQIRMPPLSSKNQCKKTWHRFTFDCQSQRNGGRSESALAPVRAAQLPRVSPCCVCGACSHL